MLLKKRMDTDVDPEEEDKEVEHGQETKDELT